MKTFRHSGKIGDVIYSLPAIRELGGGILYLPESTPDNCPRLYSNLLRLLELQPFIHEVRRYPSYLPYKQLVPGIHIDYDMDIARDQPQRGIIHIVKRYLDAFNISLTNWKDPWLTVDEVPPPVTGEYVVINFTNRHVVNELLPSRPFDWGKLVNNIQCAKVFVGSEEEHSYFCSHFRISITFISTSDVLELARVIKGAREIYCNQSSALTLAQGLSKRYFLFPKPHKTNCIMGTPNETILK